MATSTGSVMDPSSEPLPFPLPTEEETCKYMQYFSDSLSMRIHKTAVVEPEDLGKMMASFQMIGSGFVGFLCKEYNKLHEKYAIDVKKLVDEKADLEKRLSSVVEKLNREMEEFRGLNSKLNLEMEEVRGLYSKLNLEMEEVRGLNSKLSREMGEVRGLNSKLSREMGEVRGLNSKLNHEMEEVRGRNSKVSKRLVELGGQIEVAREESEFLRSKNERLCSEAEVARVENERLQGLVDGFGAKEHAIKLEGVNEYASGPRFGNRLLHLTALHFMLAGQMGVNQMAKIAGVPSVPFKLVPGWKPPNLGPYKIPKLGEVELDNEKTLEAWNVTEHYIPKKKLVSEQVLGAKRKANDLMVQPASRPWT